MMRYTAIRWHVAAAGAAAAATKQSKAAYYWSLCVEGMRHLYYGFRLFGVNTKLAWKYTRRLQAGVALTRRERLLLERATVDLLRLVPFSFFIIVPFAEFLLPVALKMFPGLIPSTFETESQGRTRAFQGAVSTMKARKRLLEFMTTTVLATHPEHSEVLRRAATGDSLDPKMIRSIAPMCAKEGPLSVHRLPNDVVINLAKTVGAHQLWYRIIPKSLIAPRLRDQILSVYRKLKHDDLQLDNEGMSDLTHDELVKANHMRGMRWTESDDTLLLQLEWWVSLAKDPKVPYNTLFWVKPTRHNIRKSMMGLPVEQRRQLLGIQTLPPTVRETLERVCEKVDSHRSAELDTAEDADEIATKVEQITERAKDASGELDSQAGARAAIGQLLTEENVAKLYVQHAGEKAAQGKSKEEAAVMTVSEAIELLAGELHYSSHAVSVVFDALEMGPGSKVVPPSSLLAAGARCREDGNPEPTKAPATAKPPDGKDKDSSTEKKEKKMPDGSDEKKDKSAPADGKTQ